MSTKNEGHGIIEVVTLNKSAQDPFKLQNEVNHNETKGCSVK